MDKASTERPILFSWPMVRAILEGRKTQTRRVIRPDWFRCLDPEDHDDREKCIEYCPYGVPGDRLWVRETWQGWRRVSIEYDEWEPITREYRGGMTINQWVEEYGKPTIEYRATSQSTGPWTPAIHMPRWASRITLELTKVLVGRVQDISEADAIAEGIEVSHYYCEKPSSDLDGVHRCDPIGKYRELWDSINAKRGFGWDVNPWVWVIEFKRTEAQ